MLPLLWETKAQHELWEAQQEKIGSLSSVAFSSVVSSSSPVVSFVSCAGGDGVEEPGEEEAQEEPEEPEETEEEEEESTSITGEVVAESTLEVEGLEAKRIRCFRMKANNRFLLFAGDSFLMAASSLNCSHP